MPTIIDRDFVIGTVVAPTVLVEPEKTEEAAAEGEVVAEGEEGTPATEEGKAAVDKTTGEKGKAAKLVDEKAKSAPSDKTKPATKETKKK